MVCAESVQAVTLANMMPQGLSVTPGFIVDYVSWNGLDSPRIRFYS